MCDSTRRWSSLVTLISVIGLACARNVVQSNSTGLEPPFSATLRVQFRSDVSTGVFSDGLTLLNAGTNASSSSSPVFGVLLKFNATSQPINSTTTPIPFVALIDCDAQTASTTSASSTASAATASATGLNVTSSNGTNTTLTNTSSTESIDLFAFAAQLNAVAAILYSSANQSCSLNLTANQSSPTIPVFSLPSRNSGNLLQTQFNGVSTEYETFNSSLLSNSTSILSTLLENPNAAIAVPYLVAIITQTNYTDNAPGVATLSRASTPSSTSAVNTASGVSPSSTNPATTRAPASSAISLTSGEVQVVLIALMTSFVFAALQ